MTGFKRSGSRFSCGVYRRFLNSLHMTLPTVALEEAAIGLKSSAPLSVTI